MLASWTEYPSNGYAKYLIFDLPKNFDIRLIENFDILTLRRPYLHNQSNLLLGEPIRSIGPINLFVYDWTGYPADGMMENLISGYC